MTSYDTESGQVYTETITTYKRHVPWEHRLPNGKDRAQLSKSRRGVPTLQDLATKQIIRHAQTLEPKTLENLPPSIAIKVWAAIREAKRESFHVWTAFVNAGFHEPTFNHSLHIHDWRNFALSTIFSKLSSPSAAWVVDLTIGDNDFWAVEYKDVSRIQNIRSLRVYLSRPRESGNFDGRILQAWSTRAMQEGAFAHLEVLSLRHTPVITTKGFECFSKFPALTSVLVDNLSMYPLKREFKAIEVLGWKHVEPDYHDLHDSSKGEKRQEDSTALPERLSRADAISAHIERRRSRKTNSSINLPILEAKIGNFRGSERPIGDATLYFERDPNHRTRKTVEQVANLAEPRKKRKIKDSKGADFAAMLGG